MADYSKSMKQKLNVIGAKHCSFICKVKKKNNSTACCLFRWIMILYSIVSSLFQAACNSEQFLEICFLRVMYTVQY